MSQLYRGLNSDVQEVALITLTNLAKMFTLGVKLTLVARHMSDDKAFAIFSDDQLEKVVETLQHQIKKRREETVGINGKIPDSGI